MGLVDRLIVIDLMNSTTGRQPKKEALANGSISFLFLTSFTIAFPIMATTIPIVNKEGHFRISGEWSLRFVL